MTKFELAGYCASLLAIIDSKEDAGQDRGGWVAAEYSRAYHQLQDLVEKEQKNETRPRK